MSHIYWHWKVPPVAVVLIALNDPRLSIRHCTSSSTSTEEVSHRQLISLHDKVNFERNGPTINDAIKNRRLLEKEMTMDALEALKERCKRKIEVDFSQQQGSLDTAALTPAIKSGVSSVAAKSPIKAKPDVVYVPRNVICSVVDSSAGRWALKVLLGLQTGTQLFINHIYSHDHTSSHIARSLTDV